ncbi:NhaA family Na+:H+ antiporter [Sphingobium jiangsuense]|uniref:Na(+)/H(+) antiporter NhaA n=1 Tax=Sphingobium jiangsuense TaxID=870476 RepID=A0A7W6BCQ6_9SPHN|nr:Na+/H+ antiporter NhaA [Sphingobium jiangsuense]MBB3924408.1 NhaA family Na+:H+ antiporter [Sphingobium jiangsuense]
MTAPAVRSSVLRDFLRSEASGGILLMLAAALAMLVANSPLADGYFHGLHIHLGPLTLLHWINDGLMALFFLLVGLEIKREFAGGQLSSWSDRALPMIAAAGGMAVPALIYLAIAGSTPGLARGWAIPSATDIAFAIGVMALLGRRVPTSLKLFLVTVAIVDDMGAVAIIALAYTDGLNGLALLASLAIMAVLFALNRGGVTRLQPYLALAALLWLAVLLSGIHATIAGVLSAMFIPLRASSGAPEDAEPPLHRLEHALQPWVAYAIVPVFGFANAGVSFAGIGMEHLLAPLPLGVAAGLFIGKQTGVLGALWLCVRLRLAPKPANATWTQIYGVCLLCGIGFTMSLFIGGLAFTDPLLIDEVKIGVLGGSILSATAGFLILRMSASGGR